MQDKIFVVTVKNASTGVTQEIARDIFAPALAAFSNQDAQAMIKGWQFVESEVSQERVVDTYTHEGNTITVSIELVADTTPEQNC